MFSDLEVVIDLGKTHSSDAKFLKLWSEQEAEIQWAANRTVIAANFASDVLDYTSRELSLEREAVTAIKEETKQQRVKDNAKIEQMEKQLKEQQAAMAALVERLQQDWQ